MADESTEGENEPRDRNDKLEELLRSMEEQARATREEWSRGHVRLGGVGLFAGMDDPNLVESYLGAARDLLDRNRDRLRQFALPIFFLQRHALELALKEAIRMVLAFEHYKEGRLGEPPEPERTHDLSKLLATLRSALGSSSTTLGKLPSLVASFHLRDERSVWARYRSDHKPVELELGSAQRDLDDLYQEMFSHSTTAEGEIGWVVEYYYEISEILKP